METKNYLLLSCPGEEKCGSNEITGMMLSINDFPHYCKQKLYLIHMLVQKDTPMKGEEDPRLVVYLGRV
jgi:hypothetical protein